MAFYFEPGTVDAAWDRGAAKGQEAITESSRNLSPFTAGGLGDMTDFLAGVASHCEGVTTTATTVIDELHQALQTSMAQYAAADQTWATTFPKLLGPS